MENNILCLKEMKSEPLRMSEPRTENTSGPSISDTPNQKGSEKETPTTIPIGRVYLITNLVNHKRYVGITTRTLNKRFREHIYDSKRPIYSVLRKAIGKYGKENFSIQLLEELYNTTEQELQLKEAFYINKHNTFIDGGWGYNLLKQSNSKLIFSEATKLKMSENNSGKGNPFYGKKHSDEAKRKMGGAVIDYRGNRNPFYGKTQTKEAREKSRKYNIEHQSGENHPRLGKTLTRASKEKLSLAHKGKQTQSSNPFFDHTIRLFRNIITGETFSGTQFDFRNKYGLKAPSVSSLCKGHIHNHKGWALD